MDAPETLRFDDLSPYLLLKNGNFLYKIPFRDGFAVVKVYYGSRSPVQTLFKSLENVVVGQTSYQPTTRLRVERECLDVWRKHGFRVYDTYDDVRIEAPQCPEGGYTVFEYRKGPNLNEYLADGAIDLEERFATYRRFLAEWGRRHALALSEREPRLVHENGDGKHVMIFDDGFHWFDFEMVWRNPARIADTLAHEIVQYLWQISKSVPEEVRARLVPETVAHYPHRERLEDAWRLFLANRRPIQRLARALDRRTARGRKPTSKYAVAGRLRALLEAG
ncbi:MAG: hypothetical protein ACQGVC_00380 [Myxococcota bacterium]